MEVNIRCSKSEEVCWNAKAIKAYSDMVNAKEARLAANPDLTIIPGKIACQGCVVNRWGKGTFCTAQLTETQFAADGERLPRPEDAFGSTLQIAGFTMIKPGSGDIITETVAATEKSPQVKHVLRRLFHR